MLICGNLIKIKLINLEIKNQYIPKLKMEYNLELFFYRS
jgi:hypothetical protein